MEEQALDLLSCGRERLKHLNLQQKLHEHHDQEELHHGIMAKIMWKRRNFWSLANQGATAIEMRKVQKKPAVDVVHRVLEVAEEKRLTLTFARNDEVAALGGKILRWTSDNRSTIEIVRDTETTRRLTLIFARRINAAGGTMTRKLHSDVVLQGPVEQNVRRKPNLHAEPKVSGVMMMKSKLIYVVIDRVPEKEKERRLTSTSDEERGRRINQESSPGNGKSSSTNAENHHLRQYGRLRRLSFVDQGHHLQNQNLLLHHRHHPSVSPRQN